MKNFLPHFFSSFLFVSLCAGTLFLAGCEGTPFKGIDNDDKESQEETSKLFDLISKEEFQKEIDAGIDRYVTAQQEEAQKAQEEAQKAQTENSKNVPNYQKGEHIYGKEEAKYVLYEYTDFHCPFCQRFHPTAKEFAGNNKGEVSIVLRPFPLDQLHPESRSVHEIGECVAKIGGNEAFWKFADAVFTAQTQITASNYEDAVKTAGVNTKEVTDCYNAGEFKEKVQASINEAQSLGIQGTPGSILKNMETGDTRFVGGAYPIEYLQQMMEEIK